MRAQPCLGTGDNLIEGLGGGSTLQLGLTLLFLDPQNGVITVGINDFITNTLLLHQGQRMDDGQELTDIVGTLHRPEMKHPGTRLQVDSLILHGAGIARAGRIYRPCVGFHLQRQGQHRIVTPIGRIRKGVIVCHKYAKNCFEKNKISPPKAGEGLIKNRITRSEEHTSELQTRQYLVCRLLLEKTQSMNKIEYMRS